MKDLRSKLAITIVCIILGIILAVQFKTVENSVGEGIIPTQRAQQLAIEYKKLSDEREQLTIQLEELEAKVKQYEKGEAENNIFYENLYKDLEKYRIFAGFEDVEGPGVIIEINDSPMEVQFGDATSTIVENYDLLLQLISVLNAAEAEAISINDQRYTSFTEIVSVGNHLEINGVSLGPPFVIKAIGKPDDLESALVYKGGIVWYLENILNTDVHVRQEQNIQITKYKQIREFRYAKPVEAISNNP